MCENFYLFAADCHRFFQLATLEAVLDMDLIELFGKYIPGLPDDSALIKKLSAPYRKAEEDKAALNEKFRSLHG